MRTLHLKLHYSSAELKKKLNQEKNVRLFRYWQLLYIISQNPGKTDVDYAEMVAMGKDNIYRIVQLYNQTGKQFTSHLQWGGRRKQTSHLSLSEEKALMQSLSAKAGQGKILTFHDIHSQVEQYIGHKVSDDYIWDLFKQHNWKKKAPRPKHPKQNKSAQKAFKKTLALHWYPPLKVGAIKIKGL